MLFAVTRPILLRIDRPVVEMSPDGTLYRPLGDAWRIHYVVESVLPKPPASVREGAPFAPNLSGLAKIKDHRLFGLQAGLDVYAISRPPVALPRLDQLAAQVTAGSKTDLEAADRISSYLTTNYQYSLQNGPSAKDSNPIEAFLFEIKKGHCEYFASAMCLMLRKLGIPARIATGFYSKEWNERGHYFVVRMRHAHAWVEAYIEPFGWISFDPTPQSGEPGFGSDVARLWEESWDFFNLRWNRYILSYDFERQRSMVEAVMDRSGQMSTNVSSTWNRLRPFFASLFSRDLSIRSVARSVQGHKPILAQGGVVLIGFLVLVIGFFWFQSRTPGSRVWFFERLLRYLESKGGKKPVALTLAEFSAGLKDKLGDAFPAVLYLQDRYYALRFDPSAMASSSEKKAVRHALDRLK